MGGRGEDSSRGERSMRIGIDAKWYFRGPAGLRWVVRNVINQLALIDRENEYIIYLNKNDDPAAVEYSAPNFVTKTLAPSQSWLRVMLRFSTVASRDRLDVLCTNNFCPLFCSCKRVTIIYDVIFETHPSLFTLLERVFFKPVRLAAHLADRIITISGYCKEVIAQTYRIPKDKIAVALLGRTEAFCRITDSARLSRVREKYALPERYILYVGRLNVRKNLIRLIDAFSGLQDKTVKLVVVGAKDWRTSNLAPIVEASSARERIIFLGFVPEEDLPCIYQLATVFAYVPLVEGFGLPPLEAMGRGVPVVTSNTSSLPEVVGDCALTVDPCNVDEIRTALDHLLASPRRCDELAIKGLERTKSFDWESTARNVLKAFESVGP